MGRGKKGKKKLTAEQLKSVLLKYFQKNPKKRINAGQLQSKLKLKSNKDSISDALDKLHKEDLIRSVSEYKYVLNKARTESNTLVGEKTFVGVVSTIRSGAAYIIVEQLDEDVYIPQRHLNGAMNRDEVELTVRSTRRKPEGRVVRVLKRSLTRVIGKLKASKNSGVVSFESRKNNLDVFINPNNFGSAKEGDQVIAEIVSWGENGSGTIWGKVVRVINDLDTHDYTMESILIENGFNSDYPYRVIKEVEKIPTDISEEDILKRKDFQPPNAARQ